MTQKTAPISTADILTLGEVRTVIQELKRKAPRSVSTRQNLAIFRLATCCGLRASEIAQLRIGDIHLGGDNPYINVRKAIAKYNRPRRIPLTWDAGTFADLLAWITERKAQGAKAKDLVVCSQAVTSFGNPLDRFNIRKRFVGACKITGRKDITTHKGRHTFISLSMAAGHSPIEVRDAAGHGSLETTDRYSHVAQHIRGDNLPDVFGGC